MKPTEDQLDQLLSAYLDDALDDDELRLLESRLKNDSEVLIARIDVGAFLVD